MTVSIKFISFVFLFFSINSIAIGQEEKDLKVAQLFEVMDLKSQFLNGIKTMIDIQKSTATDNEEMTQFWDSFFLEAEESLINDLQPKIAEVYKNNFTNEDLTGLISFYQSDIGKVLVEKTPIIMQESANLGAVWGQEIGMKIAQKMSEIKE